MPAIPCHALPYHACHDETAFVSPEAVQFLHYINTAGNDEEKGTIAFLDRVLGNPNKDPGSALLETTLFSMMETYVSCCSSDLYELYKENNEEPKAVSITAPGIKLSSGMYERIDLVSLYRQSLKDRIMTTLDAYCPKDPMTKKWSPSVRDKRCERCGAGEAHTIRPVDRKTLGPIDGAREYLLCESCIEDMNKGLFAVEDLDKKEESK